MTIRVVVVEDSPTARALLVAILQGDPEFTIVGEAANGEQAIALARRLLPDVMTVDVHMPGLNGLDAIRRIMSETPVPIVVVSATIEGRDVASSLEALQAGAVTALPRPPGPSAPDFAEKSRQLVLTVKAMSEVKVVRRWRTSPPPPVAAQLLRKRPEILAIAASTGGPAALHRVLGALPAECPVPILIVQHISPGFLPGLVEWWNTATALSVKIATHRERLKAGTIYVAPDAGHLGLLDRDTIEISSHAPIGGHRPSGTFLFDAVAKHHGSSALGLILTGMGRDGVDGLRALRELGGYVIAQDEDTSVVFGMPGAAQKAGFVNLMLPLDSIASHLASVLGNAHATGAAP